MPPDSKINYPPHEFHPFRISGIHQFVPVSSDASGINKIIKKRYNHLRMDASNYKFDSNGKLIKFTKYKNLSWGNNDYLKPYASDLSEFYVKSGFKDFYKNHQVFYNHLITLFHKQGGIEKQQYWLESHFPIKYENYRVVFSPLSYGIHATNRKNSEIMIFVSAPTEVSSLSESMLEARDSRMLFTEIDHNYVNPISDQFKREINAALSNRNKWTNGKHTYAYKDEYAVFNEYMTWSVFLLYAKDSFNSDDYEAIKQNIELFMEEYRGFQAYKWFSEKLINLYANRNGKTFISDLYPEILQYCSTYNKLENN